MNPSTNKFDKLNQLIQVSTNASADPMTKALEIARMAGAFKQSNVVFVYNQLYPINPQNPQQSIQHLKMMKQQRAA